MGKLKLVAEPGKQEVVMTREFDAPRERVFNAMTDPAVIPQWWGPRRLKTTVDKMEVRPGGMWRFVHKDEKGQEFGFHGVYHLVEAPSQIVDTFEFEGLPQRHVMMETMTLTEVEGRTQFRSVAVFQSVADRDAMVASGMESGMSEGLDRFEEVLAKL